MSIIYNLSTVHQLFLFVVHKMDNIPSPFDSKDGKPREQFLKELTRVVKDLEKVFQPPAPTGERQEDES